MQGTSNWAGGATFKKCAFQVHSPRDINYKGENLRTEADWQAFALQFASNCVEAGLDSVAITDHNDMEFFKLLRKVVAADEELSLRLTLWPAMELTLTMPCQALILFDPDLPDRVLDEAYTALTITPPLPIPEKSPEVQTLPFTLFSAMYDALNKVNNIQGKFVIIPNVTEGGSRSMIRNGLHSRYIEMPCAGGYTDGAANFKEGHARKLNGGDPNYARKAIAVVQTNDSRRNTVDSLSEFPTWIKWCHPSAESLRQAFLARQSRVLLEEPIVPSVWIREITISGSTYLDSLQITLNPQLNSIIGGRGCGKTTILEYLRWCLCHEKSGRDQSQDATNRGLTLINKTLKPNGGAVAVTIEIDGVAHTFRRVSTTGEVSLRIGEGNWVVSKPEEIQSLVPLSIFGQKELSTLSHSEESVNTFLFGNVRDAKKSFELSLDQNLAMITTAYAQHIEYCSIVAEIQKSKVLLESAEARLTEARKNLKGLTDSEKAVLSGNAYNEQQKALLESLDERFALIVTSMGENYRDLKSLTTLDVEAIAKLPESELILSESKLIAEEIAEISTELQNAGRKLLHYRTKGRFANVRQEIQERSDKYTRLVAEIQERSKQSDTQLAQIQQMEKIVSDLRIKLQQDSLRAEGLADSSDHFSLLFTLRKDIYVRFRETLTLEAERLNNIERSNLGVILELGQTIHFTRKTLTEKLVGTAIRSAKIENLLEFLVKKPDPISSWFEVVLELDNLFRQKLESKEIQPGEVPVLISFFNHAELEKIRAQLQSTDVVQLLAASPFDTVRFEYVTENQERLPFAEASAGQQASVLLDTLLNSPGTPLIIDQPEEDLDSAFISKLAERLWESKRHRQLIFASHNANLVVNGDSEYVVCLESRSTALGMRGMVKAEGSIDSPDVRLSITEVMEGGEKAFRLRQAKYGF